MMKKIFTYITALIALAACTNDDSLVGLNNNLNPLPDSISNNNEEENISNIRVEIIDPKGIGDETSRSTLIYDGSRDVMAFGWDDEDVVGVFTYPDAEHSQQEMFKQVKDAPENTEHLRVLQTYDGHLQLQQRCQYVSCFPYVVGHSKNYTNIPVDYTGQRQTGAVDFRNYWYDKTDQGFKESQEGASAHLGKYDFLCTGPTDPTPNLGIHFKLKRMGAIVRFLIQIKQENNFVYDELQLVNRTKKFTTKATMNAATCELTPTEQSHVVNLKLGAEDEGFDLTEQSLVDGKSKTFFYDYYNGKYTGYIMAYMMLAAYDLDLTPADVEKCYVYLIAHEKAAPTKKHYFKSPGLSKPNLQQNTFYKWNVTLGADTPIEFSEITVEEWREGTTFTNDGKGTETW